MGFNLTNLSPQKRQQSPELSVVVVFRNMAREAPRTLHTLSTHYQAGVSESDYEVIAIDAGSNPPLDKQLILAQGPNFRVVRAEDKPSPVSAINEVVRQSRGRAVALAIDGARMLSPGVLKYTLRALKAYRNPVVATLAWHLGSKPQNHAMLDGYDQTVEDKLLSSVDWRSDGYELFKISCLALSSAQGWCGTISESNFVTVRRAAWDDLGGLDERFQSPGGGYVSLDFYREACEKLNELVLLLGEGTFHQFHGGVATNVPMSNHPGKLFREEYAKIRGREFANPGTTPEYIGSLPPQARRFMALSLKKEDQS